MDIKASSPYKTLVKNPFKDQNISADGLITSELVAPKSLPNVPRWGQTLIGQTTHIEFYAAGYEQPVSAAMQTKLLIGRHTASNSSQPDIALDVFDAHQKGVSREHAVLLIEDGTLKIMDLQSTNGTYLNGHRLVPHQARILRDGDQLILGSLELRVSFG